MIEMFFRYRGIEKGTRSYVVILRSLLLVSILLSVNSIAVESDAIEGIYTNGQARRGEKVYQRECVACHGNTLRGAEGGTALLGRAFFAKWRSRPVSDLFKYIRASMPPTRPGKLSARNYASVIAYLLQVNGLPAGRRALSSSVSALSRIDIIMPSVLTTSTVSTSPNEEESAIEAEWPYYGGNAASQRYSPLDIVNRNNVDKLEMAWRWKADNFGPRPELNYRATPLMVDGVLYVTAGSRRAAAAIDASTGETLWTFRIDEGERGTHAPRANSGRGVAYWSEGEDKRILVVTPGFQLIALDALSGLPIPAFGREGKVDLKLEIDRDLDPETAPLGSSSPPIVVGDVIVVGSALPSGFAPSSAEMPPGHIRGYDVRSGKRKWIFHTIPHPGDAGHETWEPEAWRTAGNVAVWTTMSADQELGYVYLPLEAATADHYGGHRPGDNLYSQSLVCLDARSGKVVWHFQTVHHGIWDYDLPAAPILLDINVDGREIPAVAQVTKQAFTFVFDRRTGEPVWPIEERSVGQTDVPGEVTSPTQPFPTRPAPFDRQGISAEDLIDLTPELNAEAAEIITNYRIGPLYTPPSVVEEGGNLGTLMLPNQIGGANWPGGAVDPETGILYVGSSTLPGIIRLSPDPDISSLRYIAVGTPLFRGGPQGLPLVRPPWGRITAINLNTGDHVWMVPNGEVHENIRNHPALAGVTLPRTGRPERAGLLVTKTLLFAGEGNGVFAAVNSGGPMFRAHDKSTGAIISEFELPGNQSGLPMSYAVDGRQFIVVAVGGPEHPAELIALSLPE